MTIDNGYPKNMIKNTNFILELERQKKKEHTLIDDGSNRANSYQKTNFNLMLTIFEKENWIRKT